MNISTFTRTSVVEETFDAIDICTNYFDERRISLNYWQKKKIMALVNSGVDPIICLRDSGDSEHVYFAKWSEQKWAQDKFFDPFEGRWHDTPYHIMNKLHIPLNMIKRITVVSFI